MYLFWDLYQQAQLRRQQGEIHQTQDAVTSARYKAERVETEVAGLRRKIEHLELACQALYEILADRLEIPQEEVLRRMEEIDLRDGLKDGRITAGTIACEKCRRKNGTERTYCIYCGESLSKGTAF
jgi:hypothetical protein